MKTGVGHLTLWPFISIICFLCGFVFRFLMVGHDYIGYIFFMLSLLAVVFHFLNKHGYVKIKAILIVLIIIGLVIFAIVEVPIISASKTDKDCSSRYIVILGAGVNGSTPSLSLQNRLDAALEYLTDNPEAIAIVSGGQGRGENLTEAEAMRIWLEHNGITPDRIIKEEQATSTKENLEYSFSIMKEKGYDPAEGVGIVTSEYHLYRAKLLAEELGAKPYGIAGKTSWKLMRTNYFIREGLAAMYMKVFGN